VKGVCWSLDLKAVNHPASFPPPFGIKTNAYFILILTPSDPYNLVPRAYNLYSMVLDSDCIYAECILPLDTTMMIRVLHLNPGDENDQIRGSLRLLDLDTEPPAQYDCISYVWGDSGSTRLAIVNEKYITITRSLYDALRHIRSKTKTMIIWADAICIDQSDIDEKTRQVALMAEVYRRCSKVYIWLGSPEAGSLTGNPFEFLEHFIKGRHVYDFPGFDRDQLTKCWTWKDNQACNNILNDFLHVVKSPWWTRAWTVQECLLPKDSLVMFGTWTVTWAYMLKAGQIKNSHGDGPTQCCKEAVNAFHPHQLFLIDEWMWHLGRGQRYGDILRGNDLPLWFTFYQAILAFSSRRCLDPRDKIYSMLSLATHPVYRDFMPSYYEDVSTVYTDIFTRMVREANGDFTCFMGGGFGSFRPSLPSWVRDFSQTRPLGVVAVEERRIRWAHLYQASLAQPFQPVWNESRELQYSGTYAETVKAVGLHISFSNTVLRQVLNQWLDLCKEVVGICEPRVLRNTFSRIICGDVCKALDGDSDFRRARETDFPEEDVWNRLIDGDLSVLDPRAYGWGLNFGIWGRCFFTTYSGKMGLCHPNTLPRDEVWVMRGIQVPFVVRPLESADAGCRGKYSFLGDCFLNGIMDGELGEKEKSMERTIVMI
jgi:hypothetical protein